MYKDISELSDELLDFIKYHYPGRFLTEDGMVDFRDADFYNLNLTYMEFIDCDFTGAEFRGTNLDETKFINCILTDTCLDPNNETNGRLHWPFPPDEKGYVKAYRTRIFARTCNEYEHRVLVDGETVRAKVFSTDENTACHPGLGIWPTFVEAYNYSLGFSAYYEPLANTIIEVKVHIDDIEEAGVPYYKKWRCKEFTVVKGVDII